MGGHLFDGAIDRILTPGFGCDHELLPEPSAAPDNDRFCPTRTLTRAEPASLFALALDL